MLEHGLGVPIMRLRALLVGIPAALLVLMCVPTDAPAVRASSVVRMATTDLVDGAELVLDARVTQARALERPGGRILTELTLDVAHTYLGDPLAQRVVRLPGGVLPDGRGLVLAGVPVLAAGERCVLFLSAAGADGMRLPVGLAQGCARLHTDARGRTFATRDTSSLALLDPRSGASSEGARQAPLPYERMVREIEAAVRTRAERRAERSEVERR